MIRCRILFLACVILGATIATGCVRRTMSFSSDPQGALVWLNDREIGRTPVTIDFTWYGDYDVVYRKEGYRTLATSHRVRPPWYQVWPLDFVSEVLVPAELHDRHDAPIAHLEPEPEPDLEELVLRADEMRRRTALQPE